MIYQKPQWRLEVRATTYPRETWMPLRAHSRRYTFVELIDAEREKAALERIQPHAKFRVSPI